MNAFLRAWLLGYSSPAKLVEALRDKPAPQWGFYAQTLRALMDGLLLYLPLSLMERQPSIPSYLTFLPPERYFTALVWLGPIFLLGQWLLLSALIHLALRLSGRVSSIDLILNLTGMAALVVGFVLLIWDWIWVLAGWRNPYALGVSHLVFDVWAILITVLGFHRLMGVPVKVAIALNVLWLAAGVPLAMLIMRAPF